VSPTRPNISAIWLTNEIHAYQKLRAESLFTRGVQVQFLQTAQELKTSLKKKRVSIILLSDDGEDHFLEPRLLAIVDLPDTAGARLILDQTGGHLEMAAFALAHGFRDILPASLSDEEWLARFMFSAAVSPLQLPPPHCQLALDQPGFLEIPASLVSISGTTLRMESRLQAKPGSEVSLQGELALAIGKDVLRGKVLTTDSKKLIHKFSHSLELELHLDEFTKKQLSGLVARLAQEITHHPRRIFVVISQPAVRFQVIETFQKDGHMVRCAMNRTSVYEYLQYFSPELVVNESRFCLGENQILFEKLMETTSPDVLITILGEATAHKVRKSSQSSKYSPFAAGCID